MSTLQPPAGDGGPRKLSSALTDRSGVPASLSVAHRKMSRAPDGQGRRMSTFRRTSIAGSHRTDFSHLSSSIPVKLQNTYRMQPEDDDTFRCARVQNVIESVLRNFLQDESYESIKCSALSQTIGDVIKGRVKDMGFTRYKIVCTVAIGENGDHSMQMANRCLWNTSTDNCAFGTFKNKSLFAVGAVYGVYFE
ncbi:hypothetical protein CAPTEDRAFT_152781 [Capitella teleta]|uniref:Tctex1 domain-containing protein 1 n=1 Tax=Capitella teleta TaxID=283909 RepID=R7T7A4_CAPTE|nr:hypothetical protein CAPTEDRAFT_152781 [Capitella teleta]|eukprot:ELT87280.1 hypothetical protein CAPTEDRAFT_152781 [Capitella teleta]